MLDRLLGAFLALIIACAAFPAMSQTSIATGGAKPTSVAPQDIMPPGKFYVNTSTFPKLRFGTDKVVIGKTCTQARQANCTRGHGNAAYPAIPKCDMAVGAAFVDQCDAGGSTLIPAQGLGHTNGQTLNGNPVYTNAGSWRTICGFSHVGFEDPIVWPRRPGLSHLHQFVGNTTTGASSDLMTFATVGRSTCNGGTTNRTGYWSPVIVYECSFTDPNGCNTARTGCVADSTTLNGCKTINGQVFTSATQNFYYKCGNDDGSDCSDEEWFPVGHRMIAGKATNTDPAQFGAGLPGLSFDCYWVRPSDGVEFSPNNGRFYHIPTKAESDAITGTINGATVAMPCNDINMRVGFPNCGNGQLDAPDHISHTVNAVQNPATGRHECPADHPHHQPLVTLNLHTRINPQDLDNLRLSSDPPKMSAPTSCGGASTNYCAGLSLHADRVEGFSLDPNYNGWGMRFTDAVMKICSGKGMPVGYAADCHDNLVGDPLGDGVMWILGDPLRPPQVAP